MVIKSVLIDDESLALKALAGLLTKNCPTVEILAEFTSLTEAAVFLTEHEVDLIFLDINMPEGSGIDFAKNLTNSTSIIFVTAYDQYAIDAFKVSAANYLLKPINYKDLINAVDKVEGNLELKKWNKTTKDKFMVKNKNEYSVYNYNDIIFIEASSAYIEINLLNGKKEILAKNLINIEKELDAKQFFRIHHSFIINTSYLKKININENYVLVNDARIPISKRKKAEFLSFMKY